jgi:hypothetical protein
VKWGERERKRERERERDPIDSVSPVNADKYSPYVLE